MGTANARQGAFSSCRKICPGFWIMQQCSGPEKTKGRQQERGHPSRLISDRSRHHHIIRNARQGACNLQAKRKNNQTGKLCHHRQKRRVRAETGPVRGTSARRSARGTGPELLDLPTKGNFRGSEMHLEDNYPLKQFSMHHRGRWRGHFAQESQGDRAGRAIRLPRSGHCCRSAALIRTG